MKNITFVICLLTVFIAISHASESDETKGSIDYRNRMELFLGNTHDGSENGFSIGLGYEYRIMDLLGAGLFVEYADAPFREFVFGVPVFIHPYKGLRLLAAPGVDLERGEKGDPEFLVRLGLAYEFEFDRWSVTPEFNVDFVDNEEVLVYGVSFGWGF